MYVRVSSSQTLSSSLSRRSGELVGELRAVAAPLAGGCEPAVAAQLQRDLDDAAAAYRRTTDNLAQLTDKSVPRSHTHTLN